MLSAILLLSVGGTSVVAAATGISDETDNNSIQLNAESPEDSIDTKSSKSWSITSINVSRFGSWSQSKARNLKVTNSTVASFNGDAEPASFGYKVKLVNNNGATRSDTVGLYKNQTTHAGNNSGTVGYHYYGAARSSYAEPNGTRVKFHFSSDNM